MSLTKIAAVPTNGLPHAQALPERPLRSHSTAEAIDREQLLYRLNQLRGIIPVFAQELAGVRTVATQLRAENRRLVEEVQRLQAAHDSPGAAPRACRTRD